MSDAFSGTPVAVITGAGSGIGRATAVLLAQRGYALVIMSRTREQLTETAALTGASERVEVVGGDVGDAAQCRHVVRRAVERFGRLDVLVNNAGLAPRKSVEGTSAEEIERCFRVNGMGPAWTIHHAWGVFKDQHARGLRATPSPCIVNVSTLGTIDPFPGFFAYASSKAGVNLMARSCAKEGRAMGVRAFAVAPGAVETPMLRAIFTEKEVPASKCLSPEDIARVIVGCVSGTFDQRNGETIVVANRDDVPAV
ncbi:MAG: SDR family oxidoreductase [Phycisphaerae bacterium]|nr:SDR family oxidoreductase [Phycisphaerae bacterium]